ncbi:SLC13 family permease [Pseudodesulfovibrio sp. zrk46]|uniref:SLC13 family permease n=1 Tax=Pseudodesulfovibrio sp. zrk46 TaxID=2725288 RepID=UPI00144A15D1|nr:SLC13 family permease [Pseudodesulfovibrio sp. zrk46]QJB56504.1 sodium:sulfate symporter [Pseudodesulfovibrio sp. zrk46]
MDVFGDVGTYLWLRLPLILLFGGGYLVYRLMAATRLTDAFVSWALRRSGGGGPMLILYIIGASAVLSSFIPNTITVLTLLPVLKRLDNGFRAQGVEGMTTVLMCSAIYGAAIGGMGSMIGSPANAILFGALDLFEVAGREQITFFNWFLWSVPLVVMFVLVAWGVAAGLGVPRTARGVSVHLDCIGDTCEVTERQHYGSRLFWIYMAYWVLESVARQAIPGFESISPMVCLGFTVLFLWLVFVRSAPTSSFASGPLLTPGDMIKGVPRRGLIFMLVLAALFAVVHWLKLDEKLVVMAGMLLQGDMPGLLLFFLTVLAVIFLTEILSNTAVVAAFFTIAFYAAQGHGMAPLYLMMGVSVASTCAFMTPVATPTNALAFGEMRGASLRRMLALGFVLNVAGAALLTGWLSWVLPRVY